MTKALTSKNGGLWVQPGGPNTQPYFLGCHDLGDLAAPEGGVDLIRCFRPDGQGWDVVGDKITPPDPITASISTLLFKTRDWLEKVDCAFGLYVLQRDCGNAGIFANYVRGQILANVRRTSRSYSNLVMREEDTESMLEVELTAWPPLLDVDQLLVEAIATPELVGLNAVWTNVEQRCAGECGDNLDEGELVYAMGDATAIAAGIVFGSDDFGDGLAALAATPFAVGANKHVVAGTRFNIGRTAYRLLVAKNAEAGIQGLVARSDDDGATWTTEDIGGAAAGDGAVSPNGLFALDSRHIWLASANGYIYFSGDAGETWEVQEAAAITAGAYACIHFADENLGIAGAPGDVIAMTSDGGEGWAAVAATGSGADILACWRVDRNRAWVATDDGELWYTTDAGATWNQRTGWQGSGTGAISAIGFANEYQGFMVHNTAVPVGTVLSTIDGGFSWEPLTTPDNDGLTGMAIASPQLAYVAGEVEAGAAVALLMKVYRA